jgi:hypothetical protein
MWSSINRDHYFLETIMTALKSVLSLSTLAAIVAIPMMVSGAQASTTTKLLSCQADSRQKVVDCCQRILRTNTRPYWISSGTGACGAVVACKGGGKPTKPTFAAVVVPKPKKCVVYIPEIDTIGDGKGGDTPPPNSNPRTPNTRGGKI